MKKIFVVVVSLLLAGTLFVQPVSGQSHWCGSSPSCLQQDALNIISGARRQGAIHNVLSQLEYGYGAGYYEGYYPGSYYGGSYGYPYGYPGIGGGRVSRDIGAGFLGAAVGGAFGRRKGAFIGGAAGVGLAELGGYYADRRNRPVDCGKRKLSRDEREACAAITAQAEAERRTAAATRWLFNKSGQHVLVYDGNLPVCSEERCIMWPGENWRVDRPTSGQWRVLLEAPKGAGMTRVWGEVRSIGSQGWEILAPKEVR